MCVLVSCHAEKRVHWQPAAAYGASVQQLMDREYYANLMTLQTWFCVFNRECYCVITRHDMDLCSAKRFAIPNVRIQKETVARRIGVVESSKYITLQE